MNSDVRSRRYASTTKGRSEEKFNNNSFTGGPNTLRRKLKIGRRCRSWKPKQRPVSATEKHNFHRLQGATQARVWHGLLKGGKSEKKERDPLKKGRRRSESFNRRSEGLGTSFLLGKRAQRGKGGAPRSLRRALQYSVADTETFGCVERRTEQLYGGESVRNGAEKGTTVSRRFVTSTCRRGFFFWEPPP